MYEVLRSHVVSSQGTLLESGNHQGVVIARVAVATIKDSHAAVLKEALLKLAANCQGRLALDCTALQGFSCAWINALLEVTSVCRAANWDFAIFGLTGPARDVLRATKLDRRMTLCTDRAAALTVLQVEQPSVWEQFFAEHEAHQFVG